MSERHVNTFGTWPRTAEGVRQLEYHHLVEFASECGVEPAEPDECLACLAYVLVSERKASTPTFDPTPDGGLTTIPTELLARAITLCEYVRGSAGTPGRRAEADDVCRQLDEVWTSLPDDDDPGSLRVFLHALPPADLDTLGLGAAYAVASAGQALNELERESRTQPVNPAVISDFSRTATQALELHQLIVRVRQERGL